jgi:hypothetical protein
MHTGFWLGNQKGRDHWDDVCGDRRIKKWNLRQFNMIMWTGFIWLKEKDKWSLVNMVMNLWFHKMWEVS